ncbi:GNAT family N-acetyltransferase [Nocardioides zeae]|uniref:GNAT superfamily N-acetyltransferase n=1 Tax=Nocardioides zeae TaxID=1457234 RepID=A0AAJ1U2V1_9ACTN|nr:GNAT family N-acetyltransferase [Nocardioides zeae]MDQ1104955.1 GNAT superfamily N-acetyltransferase [Nocardioides zeae]
MARQALRIEQVRLTHPDALRLVADVQAEYAVLYGSPDETPLDPTMFDPPAGRFFVGYDADRPVATGAWRDRPDVHDLGLERAAEIKRMYVAPEARGRGLSRVVLAHLEQTARAAGHDGLVLETGTRQPAAVALYTACGYVPVTAYGHYKDAPESVYLGRRLD